MRSTKAHFLTLFLLLIVSLQNLLAGKVERLWYNSPPGNRVSDLTSFVTGSGSFPTNFTEALYLPDIGYQTDPIAYRYFTTSLDQPSGNAGSYGEFVRGYLEAPQTGNYTFWISSDDDSELWLSSNTNPTNRVRIAFNTGAVGYQSWTSKVTQRSVSIPLVRGNKYYFEVYLKQGTGADHVSVGWQLPDGTLNRPISTIYLAPYEVTYTGQISFGTVQIPTSPVVASNIVFSTAPSSGQPQSTTGVEHGNVTLVATVQGRQPISYQWYRGTTVLTPINGENLSFLTLTSLDLVTSFGPYRVVANNAFGAVTSAVATLTVSADITKPTLVSANTVGRQNGLSVTFSEPVAANALTTNFYYITNVTTLTGYKVLGASFFGADQRTVNLTTESFPVVQSFYTLVVGGVQDQATTPPNTILTNSTITFNSVFKDGFIERRQFDSITGGAVSDLTNSAAFINQTPGTRDLRTLLEGPSTVADNYGSQFVGYLVPPTNGSYVFYISSDDQSLLYLSTDENRANARVIAAEPNSSGVRIWLAGGSANRVINGGGNFNAIVTAFPNLTNGTPVLTGAQVNISVPIDLQANNRYYIEVRHKEGTGGDNIAVAWQIPDGLVVANASTPIEGAYLSTTNQPGVPVSIVTQPSNVTTNDQKNAQFTVGALGTSATYQWYIGNYTNAPGLPIADAVGSTLTTQPVTTNDNGTQYFVVVQNGFSVATSSVVRLTVVPDVTPPTAVSARGSAFFNRVTVNFSERLDEASATNIANYSISPTLTVQNAQLGPNRTNVVLTTAFQNNATVYTVTINNVLDSSSSSNSVVNPTQIAFTSFVPSRGFAMKETYLNITGTLVDNLTNQIAFPDVPDTIEYITTALDVPQTNPALDNFGIRVSGTIAPIDTSTYEFFITSDDASGLYLSSNASRTGLVADPVVFKVGANQAYTVNRSFNQILLLAGVPIYYEVLMKEGGGGDFVRAAWVNANSDPNYGNDTYLDALPSIPTVFLTAYADPQGATVGVATQPAAALASPEVNRVTMSLLATGRISGNLTPPISYIWQRKRTTDSVFQDLPDGNGANTFVTSRLQYPADHQARFRCLVSVPGASTLSAETLVSVSQDSTAPVIRRAQGSSDYTTATIVFSEPVDLSGLSGFSITPTNGGPALTLSAVRLVNLTNLVVTTSLQQAGMRYVVQLSGVNDLAFTPNTITPNSTAQFTGWIFGKGGVTAQRYLSLGTATGAAGLEVLKASPKYPNSPDQSFPMQVSEILQSSAIGSGVPFQTLGVSPGIDGFGGRLFGYIVPSVTTNYIFYLSSDDSSEFRLSTNSDPANLVLTMKDVNANSGFSDSNINTNDINSTTARVGRWTNSLVAGEAYYFEAIYKEGGGGDVLRIGWKNDKNTAAPAYPGNLIQATNLASVINPDDSFITFAPNLTNIVTLENRLIIFNGTAIGNTFFSTNDTVIYQWQLDKGSGFTNIPSATASTLSRFVTLANSGEQFRVVARMVNPVAITNISATSLLTVQNDTTRPVLLSVGRDPYFTNLFLYFDEFMATNSVTNVDNYTITGNGGPLTVLSASLRNGTNVVLVTAPQAEATNYSIAIAGTLTDQASAGVNTLLSTSKVYNTFVRALGYLRYEQFTNITGGAIGNLTNDLKYRLNMPDFVYYTNRANQPQTAPVNVDNFGAKLFGFFVPPTNGNYYFYIRGDDGTALYITTNGVRTTVAGATGANQSFAASNPLINGSTNSPPLATNVMTLAAGVFYPMEALYKEGGGGDLVEVAFTNNSAIFPAVTGGAVTIPTQFLATYADPDLATLNITAQPTNQPAKPVGATATFNVTATGSTPLPAATIRYQWQKAGLDIANATNASYTTPALALGDDGVPYRVRVYLPEKELYSQAATVTVGGSILVTSPVSPSLVITNVGSNVTFTVSVSGTSPAYQWRLNNTNLSGANLSTLTLNNVQYTNQGNYTVVITNLLGALTNGPGTLQVLVSPYSFVGGTKVGSSYGVSFATDAGRGYVVEFKDALTNATWSLLTNVTGNGSAAVITDPAATGPERYYRIRTLFP